jgi:hypothetical protein
MVSKADQTARDLAIAYRIYPKVAKPAEGLPFSRDKFQLSEICLRSFKESLGNLRVKLWVLLDGCPDEYGFLFRKYFEPEDLVLVPLPGVGNQATFGKQIELLLEQQESEIVYFAEDDYLYLPGQFRRMIEFLQAYKDVDFVTPYDHPDCYSLEIHRHPKWVRVHQGLHWRTAASTCLTFLTRKMTLDCKKALFESYCRQNNDCSVWLSLTKTSLFDPAKFLRYIFRDPHYAKIIAKAWLYGWPQILFGSRVKLWAPIPGIATHLDTRAMSPNVDWLKLIEQEAQAIEP